MGKGAKWLVTIRRRYFPPLTSPSQKDPSYQRLLLVVSPLFSFLSCCVSYILVVLHPKSPICRYTHKPFPRSAHVPIFFFSSSSFKVPTPSGLYLYWRSAVQELSTVDQKLVQSVCTMQLKTSGTFYLMTTGRTSLLMLSMVGQLTTDWGNLFQSQMVSVKKDLW